MATHLANGNSQSGIFYYLKKTDSADDYGELKLPCLFYFYFIYGYKSVQIH